MSFVNHMTREINCKIVYYGPGFSGKTTSMQHIHSRTAPEVRGKMISLATETERTLFFDFSPPSLGEIRGFRLRFHLYTVPGPVFYDASRQLILRGVDGVVFVADSQRERDEANVDSFENLESNLAFNKIEIGRVPLVFQYNKQDLGSAMPVAELDDLLNPGRLPSFGSTATSGAGVFETLKEIARRVVVAVRDAG